MQSSNGAAFLMLQQQLLAARNQMQAIQAQNTQGEIMQVSGVGHVISSAYEQLRNAAEYTEEHLLLQRALRRFYTRNLSFIHRKQLGNIGEELIIELTHAGYLRNKTMSTRAAAALRELIEYYYATYWQLRDAQVSREIASDWMLDLLSVETEERLNPHHHLTALAYVAYAHYLQLFPRAQLTTTHIDETEYDISLYIAVHQSLLKSDIASVRHDLMRMYRQGPHNLHAFIEFNKTVTRLYTSPLTQRLKRTVNKYGAPMRILKSMADDQPDLPELLADRDAFLAAYAQQTMKEYRTVTKRLNKGIIKSIIFLFITKVIIGLGIEIPYDWFVVGHIALLPLAINLLFPPLYMASLKLGLKAPSAANADALKQYIDRALYGPTPPELGSLQSPARKTPLLIKLFYTILFFIPFAITVFLLHLLQFNIVQGIIFFVFLSTASFLGFRLSGLVRELELVTKQQNFLSALRDFFYLPFIVIGQWLSSKYAKINAVAFVLDMAIELPLKTLLRLVRQWTRFLNEKHEELY